MSLNFDESNILSSLAHKTIQRYAYIKHDKDTVTEYDVENDKSHWIEADLGKKKNDHWQQVQAAAKYLKELQENYEEMQAEEAEIKKEQVANKPAKHKAVNTVRQVPIIDESSKRIDDYEKK